MAIFSGIAIAIVVAMLTAAFVYWGMILIGKLFDYIENKIKKNGNTVLVANFRDIITKELENGLDEQQTHSLAELRRKIGQNGLMTAEVDTNNKILPETIELIGADEMDDATKELMEKEGGKLLVNEI